MRVLGIIPARYGATRFPGKPLADIGGKTLVQRVWERASQCERLSAIVVATEDQRIVEHVESFGGIAALTSPDHHSGTDRLGEIAGTQPFDYYVNVQGDEPLLNPAAVDALIERTLSTLAPMSTIVTPLSVDDAALDDPNIVKVVTDKRGYALYFSRSRIPYPRDAQAAIYFKHIGIYMYSRDTLLSICDCDPVMIERAEGLEQLRALWHGIRILCVPCEYSSVEVNAPEDVARVLACLGLSGAQ